MVTKDYLQNILTISLEKLYDDDNDYFLIKHDVNERSITHKLACYIQEEIDKDKEEANWNVDCEYNRIGSSPINPKRLMLPIEGVSTDDIKAKTVFPDIIIHHRGKKGINNNLLVIEVKKVHRINFESCEVKHDFYKLDQYTNQLKYQFGLFLNLNIDGASGCWWINGKREFQQNQPKVLYSYVNIILT